MQNCFILISLYTYIVAFCETVPIYSRWELGPLKLFAGAVDNVKYNYSCVHVLLNY